MKVIKRDGRAVEYDKKKIEIAISKANKEVVDEEKATDEEISKIINYIETLGRKRMLVEDIQDIIEQQLMKLKKYNLAKKYIVYRYTRALVRKQNTTDETILGIIRNEKNYLNEDEKTVLVSSQRNYIAGEVSRDLTKRLLLPEKITKPEGEGIICFHNANYFIQPMINSSYINLDDMLKTGVNINGYYLDSPSNFSEACNILLEIVLDVASNQYGMQIVNITNLAKFVQPNEKIEDILKQLKNNLNTIRTTNGKLADIKFIININSENQYLKNIKEIKEVIEKIEFINNKNIFLEIIDKPIKETNYIPEFDQGKVSVNIDNVAQKMLDNNSDFKIELEKALEFAKDALMYKHYSLIGTLSDASPILWQEGGIAKLKSGEKIDELLNNGISTLTLIINGLDKAIKIIKTQKFLENEDEIKSKITKFVSEKIKEWELETGIKFNCNFM